MPPTVLTPAQRFYERGRTKLYWSTSIASATYVPTRSELDAATTKDISAHVMETNGWNLKANLVTTPNLATNFDAKIPGQQESDDSSLTCYQSLNGIDSRVIFPLLQTGFIIWLDGGDITGNKMDIYPVQVSACAPTRPLQGAAMVSAQFAILDKPAQYVTIP